MSRRTVRSNLTHERSAGVLRVEGFGQCRSHILGQDSDVAVLHFAVGDDLIHVAAGHVDGDCEPDALIAARIGGENRGVDADQMAFVVNERAA